MMILQSRTPLFTSELLGGFGGGGGVSTEDPFKKRSESSICSTLCAHSLGQVRAQHGLSLH